MRCRIRPETVSLRDGERVGHKLGLVRDLDGQKLEIVETSEGDRRSFRSAHSSRAAEALGERAMDADALTVDQIDDGPGNSLQPLLLESVPSAIQVTLPSLRDVSG